MELQMEDSSGGEHEIAELEEKRGEHGISELEEKRLVDLQCFLVEYAKAYPNFSFLLP
jgi:hypothetical protein